MIHIDILLRNKARKVGYEEWNKYHILVAYASSNRGSPIRVS